MKNINTFETTSLPQAKKTSHLKTIMTLILLKLFASWCVIEGDKDLPPVWRNTPCGNIFITKPDCSFEDSTTMKVDFLIDQITHPDQCDTQVPIDLKIDIVSIASQPVQSRQIIWTDQAGNNIFFSAQQPIRQDITNLWSYTFTWTIQYTQPLHHQDTPLPEIRIHSYETTPTNASWPFLATHEYQFPCTYEIVTPPCNTEYLAYCHALTWAPEDGIATYVFNVCNPMSMQVCFAVAGAQWFTLKPWSKVHYQLINEAGQIVQDTRANPTANTPITFPQGNTTYRLHILYRGNKDIPANGTTTLHIPPTVPTNQQANDVFWTTLPGSVLDTDCSS